MWRHRWVNPFTAWTTSGPSFSQNCITRHPEMRSIVVDSTRVGTDFVSSGHISWLLLCHGTIQSHCNSLLGVMWDSKYHPRLLWIVFWVLVCMHRCSPVSILDDLKRVWDVVGHIEFLYWLSSSQVMFHWSAYHLWTTIWAGPRRTRPCAWSSPGQALEWSIRTIAVALQVFGPIWKRKEAVSDSRFIFVPKTDAAQNSDDVLPGFTPGIGNRHCNIQLNKWWARPSAYVGDTAAVVTEQGPSQVEGNVWPMDKFWYHHFLVDTHIQLDWQSETNTHEINLPRDQESYRWLYDRSETTNEKLSSRRIHWCGDPSSIFILWRVILGKQSQKLTKQAWVHEPLDPRRQKV